MGAAAILIRSPIAAQITRLIATPSSMAASTTGHRLEMLQKRGMAYFLALSDMVLF